MIHPLVMAGNFPFVHARISERSFLERRLTKTVYKIILSKLLSRVFRLTSGLGEALSTYFESSSLKRHRTDT